MRPTHAIVAVKSPDTAKRRLAPACDDALRARLMTDMATRVLDALRAARGIGHIHLVTASSQTAARLAAPDVQVIREPSERGTASAFALGLQRVQNPGARTLLLAGDLPLADAAAIETLLACQAPVVVVPDRHLRGTNALLLGAGITLPPCFGADSLRRHRQAATARGLAVETARIAALMLDVDEPEDLARWRRHADQSRQEVCDVPA